MIDKYNIEYKKITFKSKTLFIFINHKTTLFCWAKIKQKHDKIFDVITFDSHKDFRSGVIINPLNVLGGSWGSKYVINPNAPKHFSECEEFTDWDLLDKEQNEQVVRNGKFLTINNDNFIDVAFMKNVIKDVYWYYIEQYGNGDNGKCEDHTGKDHFYYKKHIDSFKFPEEEFILDIDLDYFIKFNGNKKVFSYNKLKKSLEIIKKLRQDDKCIAITLALEPDWLGERNNLNLILNYLELNPKEQETIEEILK